MKRTWILILFLLHGLNVFSYQQQNFSAFVYHRFGDERFPSTNINADAFEAHLKYLVENEYLVLSLSDALKELEQSPSQTKDIAVITIDDAYRSFYEVAWPLLQQYNMPATLYINTATISASDYMSWNEIKEVSESGIEIGNHSHSHDYFLNNYKTEHFLKDLNLSQSLFKEKLGRSPTTFAYPFGEWNEQMKTELKYMGFASAVAQNSGVVFRATDRFSLPRFPISNDYASIKSFGEKLRVNALEVSQVIVHKSGSMGTELQPRLVIQFKEGELNIQNLQVFIQGSPAIKSASILKDKLVELTIRPQNDLKTRRTLFTVTVPNRKGEWSWFSYSYLISDKQ